MSLTNRQIQTRLDRIDQKLRNINSGVRRLNYNSLKGDGVYAKPLRGLQDIDQIIDNIKTYDDAIRARDLLLNNIQEAERMYASTDELMIMDDSKRKNIDIYREAGNILDHMDPKVVNYIAAIIDPEYNYNTGVMVKQPSLMNPPSVSIPIKTLTTINNGNSSSLCIAWNPTMFCTVSELSKIKLGFWESTTGVQTDITANKLFSVLYSIGETAGSGVQTIAPSSWSAPVYGIPDNLPEVGVSKARLVSSKIKISFRGPVLQQGGTIMAAATFQGPPGVIAHTGDDNKIYMNDGRAATWLDLFKVSLGPVKENLELSPFEEKVISNGIWAKNINITKDANGISAIFIPTDPMDEIFCKPGTYYGEKVQPDTQQCQTDKAASLLYSDKGARLNYIFNIQGISGETSNPITVETYTTWEVLPTSQSASTLRNSASIVANSVYADQIKMLIGRYLQDKTGISREGSENMQLRGFLDWVKNIGNKVRSGVDTAVDFLNRF